MLVVKAAPAHSIVLSAESVRLAEVLKSESTDQQIDEGEQRSLRYKGMLECVAVWNVVRLLCNLACESG